MTESICLPCIGSSVELSRPDDPPLTGEQIEARWLRDLEDLEASARNLAEGKRQERLALIAALREEGQPKSPEGCSFCSRSIYEIQAMVVASPVSICDICLAEVRLFQSSVTKPESS